MGIISTHFPACARIDVVFEIQHDRVPNRLLNITAAARGSVLPELTILKNKSHLQLALFHLRFRGKWWDITPDFKQQSVEAGRIFIGYQHDVVIVLEAQTAYQNLARDTTSVRSTSTAC